MYEMDVTHDGLNKYRRIRGSDPSVVRQKAEMQMRQWEEMWERKQEADAKRAEKEAAAQEIEQLRNLAEEQSVEAQDTIATLQGLLKNALLVDDVIDWSTLIRNDRFSERSPREPRPDDPGIASQSRRPERASKIYRPKYGLLGRLLPSIRRRRREAAELLFRQHIEAWEQAELEAAARYQLALTQYKNSVAKHSQRKAEFTHQKELHNDAIRQKEQEYLSGQPGAIVDYCEMVLTNSQYPAFFPRSVDLDFEGDNGHLIVDYALPSPIEIPRTKEVQLIQSRRALKPIQMSDREFNSLYDEIIYQVSLRTLHELFEADTIGALSTISFNGFVTSTDLATGHESTKCILSLQAGKEEFTNIELENVDPRACFRTLKGVASSKLHTVTPIAPLAVISKEDRRFVDAYAVADGLDDSVNIAAMDWEDFEHLIRELFEKEFQKSDGEVKVTRASRDGGVDAVAFDPDPIRGGKIVIQAKRYTNTVGVSAVRDLYGTVLNEGATKGILVTTANYGPDAYEFAKDKPLTLLNGSNLLHLLDKHGHKAKIDIQAAKREQASKSVS